MYATVCGRLNHLSDDWPNEGGIGDKGIKGNALCNSNLRKYRVKWAVQMSQLKMAAQRIKDMGYVRHIRLSQGCGGLFVYKGT